MRCYSVLKRANSLSKRAIDFGVDYGCSSTNPKSRRLWEQPYSPEACLRKLFHFIHHSHDINERYRRVIFHVQVPKKTLEFAKEDANNNGVSTEIYSCFHSGEKDANICEFVHHGPYALDGQWPFLSAAVDFFNTVQQSHVSFLPFFRGNTEDRYFVLVKQERHAQKQLREMLETLSASVERYVVSMLIVDRLYRAKCYVHDQTYFGPWRESSESARDAVAYLALVHIDSSPNLQRSLRISSGMFNLTCFDELAARKTNEESMGYSGAYTHERANPPFSDIQSPCKRNTSTLKPRQLLWAFFQKQLSPQNGFAINDSRAVLESFLVHRKLKFGEYYLLTIEASPGFSGFGTCARVVLLSHTKVTFPFSPTYTAREEADTHACFRALVEIRNSPLKYGFYRY